MHHLIQMEQFSRLQVPDKTIRLWNVATGEHKKTVKGHRKPASTLAFSPDGGTLASMSGEGIIRLWDVDTGKRKKVLKAYTGGLYKTAFSPDGKRLVSQNWNGTFQLWDVATGKQKKTGIISGAETIHNDLTKLSPDFQTVATVLPKLKGIPRPYIQIGLWDVATGEQEHTLIGHTDSILSISFSPDGSRLASSANETTVQMWDVTTGEQKQTFVFQDLPNRRNSVGDVAFSSDGSILVCSMWEGPIYLWDAFTTERKKILIGHAKQIVSMSFSADNRTFASESKDGTVLVWDISSISE